MVEVIVTQSRVGPAKSYKSGGVYLMTPAKAAHAVANGWAKYVEEPPVSEAKIKTATDKAAEGRVTQEAYNTGKKRRSTRKKTK